MQPARKRRGTAIFWLSLLCVFSAIGATVLLANDKHNLRVVLARFGYYLPQKTMTIPKPGRVVKFKADKITGRDVMIDPHVLAPEVKGYTSGLMRKVFKSGAAICDYFRKSGLEMTEWQASQFNKKIYECYAESTFPNPDSPDDPSTFFLMVKASPSGALISSRLKIIFTTLEGREKTIALALKAVQAYGEATGWRELLDERGRIERLEPFSVSQFGTNIKFSAEFGGPGRYNLIITLLAKTPETKRTEAFFRRENYFPLLPDIANGGDRKPQG